MSQINRRDFIRKGALGAIGLTILPTYLKSAPSDRLRIAHIGLGNGESAFEVVLRFVRS